MHVSWVGGLIFAGWFVLIATIMFFSLRSMIRFWGQVKRNRAVGMYDDPEFKRRIRPLIYMRFGLVGAEILVAVVAIWAFQLGFPPEIGLAIAVFIILVISVWLHIVDRRWRKLMTKGIE